MQDIALPPGKKVVEADDLMPLAEQTLALRRPKDGTCGWALRALAQAAREKIVRMVGRADEGVLAELFPVGRPIPPEESS